MSSPVVTRSRDVVLEPASLDATGDTARTDRAFAGFLTTIDSAL